MKKDDIPQQPHSIYEGETKAVYAVNADGKLEMAQTSGWEAESTVLQQALEEIDRLTDEARTRALAGQTSPLEYHMYRQRLDLPMLAQACGTFQWRVKRHFNPQKFNKLSYKQLELYSSILGISIEELTTLPEEANE
jgi:hypothetical protein